MTYTTNATPNPDEQPPTEEEVLHDSDYLEDAYVRMGDSTSDDEEELPDNIGSALSDTV